MRSAPLGLLAVPTDASGHRFPGALAVYLHHDAARYFAIDGDVEEDSRIRHFSSRTGAEELSGGVESGRDAEKGSDADPVYITRQWAAKMSQSPMPEQPTESPISQSAAACSRGSPARVPPPLSRLRSGQRGSSQRLRSAHARGFRPAVRARPRSAPRSRARSQGRGRRERSTLRGRSQIALVTPGSHPRP